jgi:iron-sulfur cluster repair protein YtfE (RIC family)
MCIRDRINPSGESIFNCHLKSPVHANIDEPLPAACGSWKLKYKSLNGAGKLTLHVYIDF